jgi:hydrogenase maturation protein HypF
LLKDGKAILSQHMGDLEDVATFADYKKNLALYENLFQSNPAAIAIDKHPEYLSNKFGRELSAVRGLPLWLVQHHHAHVAACLFENQRGLNEPPVLGVVLDGLGYGENNELWGGEFLLADYRGFERLGTFKPVALLGGSKAMREPWRNTFAHLMAEMGWPRYLLDNEELELTDFLKRQKVDTLLGMLASGTNSPVASSAGRLFDAVAAACGVCRESASYEGQAAIEFEALACAKELELEDEELVYPFGIPVLKGSSLPYVEPIAMWQALLGDLSMDTPVSVISARFHKGLAKVIAAMVKKLSMKDDQRVFDTVALSGGVFQNSLLLRLVVKRLEPDFKVITHSLVPANDGGIALGQAAIAAANSSMWSK